MRHLYDRAHLGRTRAHRKALFGNLSASLFLHRRVVTTLGKARYARRFAERLITFARRGDLAARRHVSRFIRNPEAVKKLFDELGGHFKNREGGYTRLIKLGTRRGDGAPMALLELVGFEHLEPVVPEGKATSPAKKSGSGKAKSKSEAEPETTSRTKGKKAPKTES